MAAVVAAVPAEAAPRCSGKGARGLASSASARVFVVGEGDRAQVYACLYSQNRRRRLGKLTDCVEDVSASRFVLSGRYVGYVEEECDNVASTRQSVVVRNLRTGRVKYRATGDFVDDLAMTRTGSVVWIGSDSNTRQVRMMFAGHAQANGDLVDEGPGIRPGSLALGRPDAEGFSWAYWRHGDEPRTARLPR